MKYPSCEEFGAMTADEFESFWRAFEKLEMVKTAPFSGRWFIGKHEIGDMITLKRHGYKPAYEGRFTQPMSWFWRRPLRPGTRDRLGKMITSTSAAMSDLRRSESGKRGPVRQYKIMVNVDGEMHPGLVPARGPLGADLHARNLCGYLVSDEPIP